MVLPFQMDPYAGPVRVSISVNKALILEKHFTAAFYAYNRRPPPRPNYLKNTQESSLALKLRMNLNVLDTR